jgi:subtilisin-like proprotein convertase family protein
MDMRADFVRRTILGCLAVLALTAIGCGGAELECGPGTERDGDECTTAEQTVTCGPGTETTTEGTCAVTGQSCGEGLIFNPDAERCVRDRDECLEGTTFDGGDACLPVASCGEGAVRDGNVCVPDGETVCGSGALAFDAESNACVVAEGACSQGTRLSAEGTCVVADEACSEGLALSDSGTCEPTEDICDGATVFVETEGLCLPESTCEQGDVVLDTDGDPSTPGICVTEARRAAEQADVSESENATGEPHNDPSLGGTATELDFQDDSVAFTGTIQPPTDRNGDGDSDQDRDAFAFTGSAGAWFELSVQSLGAPTPWFRVTGPNGFEREAMVGGGSDAARYLRLPADGQYTITVLPEAARQTGSADGSRVGPIGGADWDYVGQLQPLQAPSVESPNLPDDSPLTGNLADLRDNLYSMSDISAGTVVEIEVSGIGNDARARLQLWTDQQTLALDQTAEEGDVFYALVPASGDAPNLMLDWISADGPATDYRVTVETVADTSVLGDLGAGNSVSSTAQTLSDGATATYAVSLPADHVVELTHDNAEDEEVDATVVSPTDQTAYTADPLEEVDNLNSAGEDDDGYFYTESGGLHLIELTATDALTDHTLTVQTHEPISLGTAQPGSSLQQTQTTSTGEYRSDYYRISVDRPVSAEFTFTATAPTPTEEIDHDLKVHDLRRRVDNLTDPDGRIAFSRDGSDDTSEVTVGPVVLKPGDHLLGHGLEAPLDEVEITGSFEQADAVELEPNDRRSDAVDLPADTTVVGDATSDDRDVFTFQPNTGSSGVTEVVVRARHAEEDTWRCRLVAPDGTMLDEVDDRDQGCVLRAATDRQGTHRVLVNADPTDLTRYTITRNRRDARLESEPNNRSSLANPVGLSSANPETTRLGRWTSTDTTDRYELDIPSNVKSTDGARLFVSLSAAGPDPASGAVEMRDGTGATIGTAEAGKDESISVGLESGKSYRLVVRGDASTIADTDGAYELEANLYIPDVVRSASPNTTIKNNGTRHQSTVNVSSCSQVSRVVVATDITYQFRSGLAVWLTGPTGQTVKIWNENGGFDSDLVGTFPFAFTPANSLSTLTGGSGNGDWTLEVEVTNFPFEGNWNSWSLQLTC